MPKDAISEALKMTPYGFYAVGSRHEEDSNIMVVNWLTQASFEPQLIVVALMKEAHSYTLIEKSGSFTVNLFSKEDKDLLMPFTRGLAKKPEKMKDASYKPSPMLGCPVLEGAVAFIECEVVNKLETGGDHDIFLAEVVNGEVFKSMEAKDMLTLPEIGWSYAG